MCRKALWPVAWVLIVALGVALGAGGLETGRLEAGQPEPGRERLAGMAARVDALLAQGWQQAGVTPVPTATDAEFLRRAHLDLTGIIPTIEDVRSFLSTQSPDKRAVLIDQLLKRPNHATHLANTWRSVMLPQDANVQQFGGAQGFETWLRGKFADNTPYDKLVTEVLLASGNAGQGPVLFYTALQNKPEELASSTARIFMGVKIECAQCHDHPFDHWTRQDFWGYAAFFGRLQQPPAQQQVVFQVADAETGEVKLPGSDQPIPPKFLGGDVAQPEPGRTRRMELAIWLTGRNNPYFARATVNRTWAHLFGRGLVDPVDDLGRHNHPSHPQLLDELAAYFVETGFDLRLLIRTLANTQAYQLSSEVPPEGEIAPELFARMSIKSLNAEQIYDCLKEAMRQRDAVNAQVNNFGGRGFDQNRIAFLSKFEAPTQGATEFQAGIPQALTLMNGDLVTQATDLGRSDLLAALEAPFFTDPERVEILFYSTLSRAPREQEQVQFVKYVEGGGPTGDRKKALGDVLWALLNSAEFILNH